MKHTWCILGMAILCVSFNVAENRPQQPALKNPISRSNKIIELSPEMFVGHRIPISRHSKGMIPGDSSERWPVAAYRSSSVESHSIPPPETHVHWGNDHSLNLNTSEFVITVGVGTPPKAYIVEIDTGSSLSWMHCESQSSISNKVFCGSSLCVLTGETLCNEDADNYPDCPYLETYGDGSSSTGIVYQDTIWFSDDFSVPNFTFGCATMASGFGKVHGVLGLGNAPTSVFKQSPVPIDGFMYCLPSPGSERGFLIIGSPGWTSKRFSYTKLLTRKAHPEYYYVDLVNMSVNGTRLMVPTETFTRHSAIVDCGAELSYIPQDALNEMKRIVRQQMHEVYGVEVEKDKECYDLTRVHGPIHAPSVTLHFNDGAAWELDPEGIFYDPEPDGKRRRRCLAFEQANTYSIIGNLVQLSRDVVYDLQNRTIGFGPVDHCY